MRLKGIALPVNSVVIIALAMMVLLMLAAFFAGGFRQGSSTKVENAWNNGCRTLEEAYNCDADDVSSIETGKDVTGDDSPDDLLTVCKQKFDDKSLNKYFCRNKCCRTTIVEGTSCGKDKDCQSGLGKGDWTCDTVDSKCCPSEEEWCSDDIKCNESC